MNPRSLTVVVAWLLLGPVPHGDAAPPKRVREHPDLVYARVDGEPLALDLYVPESEAPPPLVVWIHGGGWRGGSRKKPPLQPLLHEGFALASVSYRLTDKAIFPAQIHDCKAAVRWLRRHAQEYGYRAERVGVAGSSAGGHLALLMGTSGRVEALEGDVGESAEYPSTVQAVVDFFGPSDFVLRGETQPERAYTEKSGSFALLGGLQRGSVTPAAERFASPVTYVSTDDPPLLVFHGANDQVVLLDQSERIVERYRAAGVDAKLVVVEGAGHGGKPFYLPEHQAAIAEFFESHLQRPD